MYRLRIAFSCLVLSALSIGCASTLAPIGPGHIFEPDKREKRLWRTSRNQATQILGSGIIYQDEKLEEYVQSVLVKILANNFSAYVPLKPQVHIIDSPVVNAFCFPHGGIFIHTGLLGRIRSEAQLAMLLGHEITHATHRHACQEIEDTYARTGANSYISVFSTIGGGNIQNAISGLSSLITLAAISGYSRDKEREADRVGLILIAQAGYDPKEGAKTFERMLEATDKKARHSGFLYATHPKMKKRVRSCRKLLERFPPKLQEKAHEIGRDRYLTVASELIYEETKRHIAQGKFDLAFATLKFMNDARQDDAEALGLLGDLYHARSEKDDRDAAGKAYRDALAIDPDHPLAHRGLGLLCMKEGNKEEASKHFERYLAISPDASDAAYIRQYLDQLIKEK